MRWIVSTILIFLMSTTTGCQILRDTASDIVTFPQELEKSSNSTIRAASRISQKVALKQMRRHIKGVEKDRFRADPPYRVEDLSRRLDTIHNYGKSVSSREYYNEDYEAETTKDRLFDERDRKGERPIPVMGNKEITVDDEGSVKVDLPKLYERWIGWTWPFGEKEDKDTHRFNPKYKWDADAKLSFDSKRLIDNYRVEVGLTRYSKIFRKKQWRLSLDARYKSEQGDWVFYMQWQIPW